MNLIDFDHGTVTGNILGVALPMLVAQILSLLYNIVDRIYIARIPSVGTTALGAVGLCFPIIVIITAFSNLFGSGGAPLFSINRGKGNIKKAEAIMNTSFSMLCICGVTLMVIGMLFASPILVLFGASYLFTQEMQPDEVWIALWNFNMVGFWTEWFESGGKTVRIAYLGANLSFEFAAAHQVRPDAETLCAMMRALTGKDKLEILRRCAAEPFSAAQLAASMNLNSGTVSRNVYGLYKLGYLETRGDGERVNYITRPDALERLFRWVLEYVSEQK